MTRILQGVMTVLDGVQAAGEGAALNVASYKTIIAQVSAKAGTVATVKFADSMSLEQPDFSIAASYTNRYDFINLNWLNVYSSNPGYQGLVIDIEELFVLSAVTGTFLVGEIVTGGTSAKTATVVDVGNNQITVSAPSGAFTPTETITGGTSAATATLTSATQIDVVKIFEVNSNYIKWLCPIVSQYTSGTISVEIDAANDYTR